MCKKIKTTITLAPHIKEFASKEAKSLGLDFSAYITILIAEKMRSTIITSPVKNITNDTSNEIAAEENKDTITIDSEQENEIDRLLQW
ncbi:hypothetical protein [Clostridium saccharobutylicum]|uniref:Uncharacterized protein n=1 Tax=Clostridium saccharobutylicum DSM 13864 TaxID=1345695 RepID=U5MXX0_CLOSA|nr:hypothetical protein [Clostridium saccharobutylicum]AGX45373.1 hypothetical protein CLSA_c44360 [Clostridium saccharobutylicum DSM 13864]AQR92648.1 hypothetical protein CLOSC_44010 [Clostridium saccharobutylicum]AQS02550.1 hypothetical protein CSACC_44060 [Clostridium saccharobutylicum]AQS12155.1 hypothetical protein CLOBY_43380 [Clostridium saccharobutylicum]AQS16533.1 hypothetical protein CLOSACC_44060 [Clostridium saccharobutylicum]